MPINTYGLALHQPHTESGNLRKLGDWSFIYSLYHSLSIS